MSEKIENLLGEDRTFETSPPAFLTASVSLAISESKRSLSSFPSSNFFNFSIFKQKMVEPGFEFL